MNSQLYIPKRINVGFQKRDDTFTGQLAYIIYWDDKGKLRKESSWQSWRNKDIPNQEFDNEPLSGLVLNKDIKRYNWGHFSSNRTMIRVHDPRGFEFEITTENLIGVLMNTDCSKRGLMGEFVYAWHGTDLVLLPVKCEEYEKATTFTDLQAGKIKAADLIPGHTYKSKQQQDYVYVGRYMWYKFNSFYYYYRRGKEKANTRIGKKYHIFTTDNGKTFETKSSLEFLARRTSESPTEELANIIESFQKRVESSQIVKWELVPVEFDTSYQKKNPEYMYLERSNYFEQSGDMIYEITTTAEAKWERVDLNPAMPSVKKLAGYRRYKSYKVNIDTLTQIDIEQERNHQYYYGHEILLTEDKMREFKYNDLYVTFEDGKRVKVNTLQDL